METERSDKISDELIESIEADLKKVSGVIEDINNFEPFEKNVPAVSFRTNLRASSKFLNKKKEVIQYYYEVVKNEDVYDLRVHSINLSKKLIDQVENYSFKKNIKEFFSDKVGTLFILNSEMEIFQIGNKNKFELKLKENGHYRVSRSTQNICLTSKTKSSLAIISLNASFEQQIQNNLKRVLCTKRGAVVVYDDYLQILVNKKNHFEKTADCINKRVFIRNDEGYLSCKKIGEKRLFYKIENLKKAVVLPPKEFSSIGNFATRLKKYDLERVESASILSLNKLTEEISSIEVKVRKTPQRVKLFNKSEEFVFVGKKDLYRFDDKFNLLSQKNMPFYPYFKIENTYFNKKLEGFEFSDIFNYQEFMFKGRKYLTDFREQSDVGSFNLKHSNALSNRHVFKSLGIEKNLNFDKIKLSESISFNNSKDFNFFHNGLLHIEREGSDVTISNFEKGIVISKFKLSNISKRTRFLKTNRLDIVSYDGRQISSLSGESGFLLSKLIKKHYRKMLLTENGQQIFLSNSEKENEIEVNLLREDHEKGYLNISSIAANFKEIRNIDIIDNFLILYNRDKSFTVKKLNRSDLLLESENE